MEPRREEPTAPTPQPKDKPRRFRIVKLEERIAPSNGHGKGQGKGIPLPVAVGRRDAFLQLDDAEAPGLLLRLGRGRCRFFATRFHGGTSFRCKARSATW